MIHEQSTISNHDYKSTSGIMLVLIIVIITGVFFYFAKPNTKVKKELDNKTVPVKQYHYGVCQDTGYFISGILILPCTNCNVYENQFSNI